MKTILDFQTKKNNHENISMVTCYDYSFAQIAAQSQVDCLLVGDSLGMVMLGKPNTLDVSAQVMAIFTEAVMRGAGDKFVVSDLPFLSYRKGLTANMNAVEVIMKTGAHALKLEGADGNLKLINHIVKSGVPIMGHLGLTPQSVHQLGGFKVQGRDEAAKQRIKTQALRLQDAGAFSIVLECVPSELAAEITASLEIPTIGIGAGAGTDGQVLVLQDLLGMNQGFKAKFVKQYFDGYTQLQSALNTYHEEVTQGVFPSAKESYT